MMGTARAAHRPQATVFMDWIKEFLKYDLHNGITVGFVTIIVLSILFGRIMDSLTVKLLTVFIRRTEKRVLENKRAGKPTAAGGFFMTVSILRAEILKCLKRPLHLFWLTAGCSLGLYFAEIPSDYKTVFGYVFTALRIINVWCIIWFIHNILSQIVSPRAMEKAKKSDTPIDEVLYPMLINVAKAVIIIVGVLFLIDSCGGDISKILATLGLGAAALALASKDTLANIFGSLVVLFDHPFAIGDWVTINGFEGSVEEIRLRTTKIRTFDDTIVTIPNSLLTNTQIDKRGKYKMKMDCSFGVLYSTTPEQLDQIVKDIEAYIAENAVEKDSRGHVLKEGKYEKKNFVYVSGFGASSIDITVVAYTFNTVYKQHVKLKHEFMLEIIRIVLRAGTSFAFPTRTIDFPTAPIQIALQDAQHDETWETLLPQAHVEKRAYSSLAPVPSVPPTSMSMPQPSSMSMPRPSSMSAQRPSAVSAQNPAAVPAQIPAAVSAQNPAAVPAQTPAAVPAQIPAAVPAQIPAAVSAQNPSAAPSPAISPEPAMPAQANEGAQTTEAMQALEGA